MIKTRHTAPVHSNQLDKKQTTSYRSLLRSFPIDRMTCDTPSVMSSRDRDRTFDTWTPKLRWMPEHSMQSVTYSAQQHTSKHVIVETSLQINFSLYVKKKRGQKQVQTSRQYGQTRIKVSHSLIPSEHINA